MLCSTPDGIKGFFTLTALGVGIVSPLCSTPDGIKGFFTMANEWIIDTKHRCSTPDGIKGFFTLARRAADHRGGCAQRLTASKDSSHVLDDAAAALLEACSTPDGIKGFFTAATTSSPMRCGLCSTPDGIKGFFTIHRRRRRPRNRLVLNA